MDFVKNLAGGSENANQTNAPGQQQGEGVAGEQQKEGGGFLGGIGKKFNSATGGKSEQDEDYLDKGMHCNHQPLVSKTFVDAR